jgi:hypothetical protein
METVEVSRHPDGRRRFYGRLLRESGPLFVSERSANTCTNILKGFWCSVEIPLDNGWVRK